ncbi:MAG TPA: hypothetical protein VMN79_09960 [Casimicrobiaceae bacterium]|nr:hypothetical protein [Casimicrobiaceae bacterium]
MANLGGEPLDVAVEGAGGGELSILDAEAWAGPGPREDTWRRARSAVQAARVRLDAYAVASLEWR